MRKRSIILLSLIFLGLYSFAQVTIHVPDDMPTIQAAIDEADDGDTVLVAQGTYYENIFFNGKTIWVASHWLIEQDSAHILNTIIDGSDPAYQEYGSVVFFISGEDTTSVLCGFTVQGGSGSFNSEWYAWGGGGILVQNGGAKIIHNRVINNTVWADGLMAFGGGIDVEPGNEYDLVILRDNYIANNKVEVIGGIFPSAAAGGGVEIFDHAYLVERNIIRGNELEGRPVGCGFHAEDSPGILRNNVIDFNTAKLTQGDNSNGGGISINGIQSGDIISRNTISNNTFEGSAHFSGGGIFLVVLENSDFIFDGNVISNNLASSGGGIQILMGEPACTITNSVFIGNEAVLSGGGIRIVDWTKEEHTPFSARGNKSISQNDEQAKSGSHPVFINNTIVNNSCGEYGGGFYNQITGADVVLFNNILYENTGQFGNDLALDGGDNSTHLYNNILDTDAIFGEGNWDGYENMYEDPGLYLNTHHLAFGSPCIDEGRNDLTVGQNIYSAPSHDIDLEERIYYSIDIGADEWYDYSTSINWSLGSKEQLLKVFPNPVSSLFLVEFEIQKPGRVEYSIKNLNGQEVYSVKNEFFDKGIHRVQLDAGILKGGIYFCTLRTETGTSTQKIIKQD